MLGWLGGNEMGSGPREEHAEGAEGRRPRRRGRGRLRLLLLLAVLGSLSVFAATVWLELPVSKPSPVVSIPEGISGRQERLARLAFTFNGFDVSNTTIPKSKILPGGPPRDGIPAIDDPKFLPVSDVNYLRDGDQVLGFVEQGVTRAYPLRILVHHEIVNDTVGGRPIAVTYCPLCGTCMVFDRRYAGKELTFGVSGLLHNSDVLMYDRQTESLWSQLKMEAVAGPQVGRKMRWLASEQMTWAAWKERYPDSEVLSRDTGFRRDYTRLPYAGYESTERTMFPVPRHRDDLKNKEWVIGVVLEGLAKAYPIAELEKIGSAPVADELGGVSLTISYDAEAQRVEVTERGTGEAVPSVRVYWFAWQAFYPQTELYAHE